jgi:FAD:protein FMN transferase
LYIYKKLNFTFFDNAASGFLGLLLFISLLHAHLLQAQTDVAPLSRFEFSSPHMGTTFNIILYGGDSVHVAAAANKAFERIRELDSILSDYKLGSELNHLSATAGSGDFVAVSDDLWNILYQASKISKKTNGAFDVTIGPLVKLWRRSFRQHVIPAPERIEMAKNVVNYQYLLLDKKGRRVKLEIEGMSLDLGGIAKGYAADQAMKVLADKNVHIALVDAGGDIVLGDPPPGKDGWKIEILLNGESTYVNFSNMAIATSGDLYRYVEIDGKRYSHIIDPGTGYGIQGQSTVTVIAKSGMLADAVASALSVMGPAEGFKKIRSFGRPAVLFVQADGDQQQFYCNRRMKRLLR